MIHKTRPYRIADVPDLPTMAKMLYRNSWCLCNGFQCGDLVMVNDAFSEDGAQEFVAVKNGREIESLTVSWFDSEATLLKTLETLADPACSYDYGPIVLKDHPVGSCSRCA